MNDLYNKIEHTDPDIEKTILCSAWIKHDYSAINDLKPDDFYYADNKEFFTIIQQMYIDGIKYEVGNLIPFKNDLITNEYIASVLSNKHTVNNADLLKTKLKEMSHRRQYQDAMLQITAMIKDKKPISKIFDSIDTFNRNIAMDEKIEYSTFFDLCTQDLTSFKQPENAIKTFISDIDNKVVGFYPKQLILIAGRPGMGKTTLAQNIISNNAKAGNKGVFFTLEMSRQELYIKMLSAESAIDSMSIEKQLHSGIIKNEKEIERAREEIKKHSENMIVYDNVFHLTDIEKEIRRQVEFNGVKYIVIDYLQLIEAEGNNSNERVSKISRGLKKMAQIMDVPIIALSQFSRESTRREFPELQDLRDSGSLEQDANKVIFIHPKKEQQNFNSVETTVAIAKNRNGGVGHVEVYYDKATHRIKNLARQNYEKVFDNSSIDYINN